MASFSSVALASVAVVAVLFLGGSTAQLTTGFYSSSCPNLFRIVRPVMESAIAAERRMGASILRLLFHDCFVNGCDASLLLDDTANFTGEKTSGANNNSARGFEVIDRIKRRVERACPGVVSCADILAIASRDAVVILGGPDWDVKLGRRDSLTANFNRSNTDIPPPSANLTRLIANFSSLGLDVQNLVALSGAHTVGRARCISFREHIYNHTNIDRSFASVRQANCPPANGTGDNNLAPLDRRTWRLFDNSYYKNLVTRQGLLNSDQQLFNGVSTDALVRLYANNQTAFFADFVTGMIKMGDIQPLTGSSGEIRRNCRRVN